jgi:hypothetical protein
MPTTRVAAANTWEDNFDTHTQMGRLEDKDMGYRVFNSLENSPEKRTSKFFINNNHWMVDTAGGQMGGAVMRPDTSFKAENGKLVVEADVAAAIPDYKDSASVEIDVNAADQPTGKTVDNLYGYGLFGGQWSLGCRFQADRRIFCAMYNPALQPGDSDVDGNENGRVWQMSDFQFVNKADGKHFHANPHGEGGQYWRQCKPNEMDIMCRDRFRLELTKTSLTVYVNGYKYFEQTDLAPKYQIPDELLNNAYVYFTNWVNRPTAPAYRFHWDRVAINPKDKDGQPAAPTASPSYGQKP